MYKYHCLNPIADIGLNNFTEDYTKIDTAEGADMSKFIALIIDSMNHDVSISSVLSPTDRLHALLERHRKDLAEKNLQDFSHNQIYMHFYRPPVNSWRFYFS